MCEFQTPQEEESNKLKGSDTPTVISDKMTDIKNLSKTLPIKGKKKSCTLIVAYEQLFFT